MSEAVYDLFSFGRKNIFDVPHKFTCSKTAVNITNRALNIKLLIAKPSLKKGQAYFAIHMLI